MLLVRVVVVLAVVAASFTVPGSAPEAEALEGQAVVFVGGGWGHGVGMAQYGAYGQALEGRSARTIVSHYYTGTEVEELDGLGIPTEYFSPTRPMWVGLGQSYDSATFTITKGEVKFCMDPGVSCADSPKGQVGETWEVFVNGAGTLCKLKRNGDVVKGDDGAVLKSAGCRVRIDPIGSGRVEFEGNEYRRGVVEIRFAPGQSVFHVSVAVSLEKYLYGLAEVPSFWPTRALKAQAFAARTYAANRYMLHETPALRAPGDPGLSESRKADCWCHLYNSVADQVYKGFDVEYTSWTDAVDASTGEVITYSGSNASWSTQYGVIAAVYHSSSSGVTESNVTAWGSSSLFPYLLPVNDAWSSDPAINPNATWSVSKTPNEVAAALGWDSLRRATLTDAAPGAVVEFEGLDNGAIVTTQRAGYEVRTLFGLKSPGLRAVEMTGPMCKGRFATHAGTGASDTIAGSAGMDVIAGRGGDDVLKGAGGADLICGGSGDDDIRGGSGADVLRAGAGNDDVLGGSGRDVVRGGKGADVLDGEEGIDTVLGLSGSDVVRGGGGDDVVEGGDGGDEVFGGGGKDELRGQNGADVLKGGPAMDVCRGGNGIDQSLGCETVSGVP